MPLVDVPFSDLINKPTATLRPLMGSQAHSIRLRRRDDVDLVLTTADRYDQDHEVIAAAVRLFIALIREEDAESLLRLLPEIFPWGRFLPPDDRREFLTEFVETLLAVQDLDTLAPVTILLTQWRNTAEVHADPALLAAMTGASDDFGPVPEPPAA